jgi:DNA repair and recombination protein RAD54B
LFSGTPLQNDLKEFYAIVNLVSPGSLGSPASFTKNFEEPIVRSKQPESSRLEREIGEEKTEELNHLTSQVGSHLNDWTKS